MLEIIKNITTVNRTLMISRKIEYLVIHYVGAVSSAKNNTIYFKSQNRQASAHYFVDDYSIYQCVEEKDGAWHCGANKYYCGARNSNSIGIEMCCYMNNGVLDISDKTIENTIELAKDIMKRYNIPIENVVRHYDVTRKVCPAPFVNNVSRWNDFKNRLISNKKPSNEKKVNVIYQAYDNKIKKWWSEITNYNTKNSNGYAGCLKHDMGGLRVKLSDNSKVTVQSHIKGGKWLSPITKWDKTSNGYSGIYGKQIDAVMIKSDKHKIKYRVHVKKSNKWLPWVTGFNTKDSMNGYAGNIGQEIDAIQITII